MNRLPLKLILLLLAIQFVFSDCKAVTAKVIIKDEAIADGIIVNHYTAADGLANDIVNSVLRTQDGFMWFGTWYGLSRFDGMHFHNFTGLFPLNSDQPPRKVETMVEDGNGNIWIKTLDWRLSVLFKREDRFKDVENELKRYTSNLQIIKIQSDGAGNVLLLTKDKNLLMGSTTSDGRVVFRLLASSRNAIDKSSLQLRHNLIDVRNGYVSWVGRNYSIFTIKLPSGKAPKGPELNKYKQRLTALAASANSYRDRFGTVWTLTDKALTGYNAKTGNRTSFDLSLSGVVTHQTFCENKGFLFVLTTAGEVLRIKTPTMEVASLSHIRELSDDKQDTRFMGVYLDPNGNLWLTTAGSGVYELILPPNQFRLITLPDEGNNGIRSLFQLPDGDIWAGSRDKNLYIFDRNGQLKSTLSYADYGIGSVYFIMADSHGRLWLSTKGDGLVLATRDASSPCGWHFRHFRHDSHNPSSISGNNVYVTYEDSRHHIWAGTLDGGLNLLAERGDSVVFFNKQNGMIHYPDYGLYMEVRNMTEDRNGHLWVGTIDGLMSLDVRFGAPRDIRFSTFRGKLGGVRANTDIYTLYKDRDSNIWLCAFGGGLSRITGYDADRRVPLFEGVGEREGLENDVIVSIIEDGKGQLWLAGSHELSCFNTRAGRVRTFGRVDGLPDVEMEEGAALRNSNGELWIGCKQGILTFRPDKLMQSRDTFPVYIVGCTVNNEDIRSLDSPVADRSITYAKEIRLRHDQNMLTLTFATLSYTGQDNIICRHRLEGFDKGWHYDGHDRMASYSQVPPGKYTFVVEAFDSANPDHPSVRRLQVIISPPWWQTWWAYTLYILLALVAAYFIIRYVRYQIQLKNDLYVQSKVAEFKRNFTMEQEDKAFMQKINGIVEANLTNADFDIDALASELGMSRSALFKKIKGMTGESPSEFIKNYKLAKAVELLTHSDKSITDVAYASGFSDVGYFGKCFRKKYGMSPRDYKNNSKE